MAARPPIVPEGLGRGGEHGPRVLIAPRGGLPRHHPRRPRARAPGLLGPLEPGQVVPEAPGGHAREAAQEALEALVQGVDHAQRAGGPGGGGRLVGARAQAGQHARVARVPVGGDPLAGPQAPQRGREPGVGGPAAPGEPAERVAQVVGAADDADLEGGYAALVHRPAVPVGAPGHPERRARAVALERLRQVGAVHLPGHRLARAEGLGGARHHLAQAHAHEPGRLERHPAKLGARPE